MENLEDIRQMEQGADQALDATGLACPMPLLKARQALAALEAGQHLHVICTDPGSWRDFESFAAQGAHELAGRRQEADVYHYVLIKGR
ncbi:sulfurtransferase TusA family protein [Kushneria indalinina]|uniref:tRNA 2-thiouridine synthesizing protein A n=1 Tax=Kushneria indalinina DSM 14324 TaxID=1122140 RepID=A0A3D9DZG9_9GAMM|nr:tRNA 2-thiouridine synthesizing protein A [Kushneria indalinina DSM 14324]